MGFILFARKMKDKCKFCGGKIEKAPKNTFGVYGVCKRICKDCGCYYFYD